VNGMPQRLQRSKPRWIGFRNSGTYWPATFRMWAKLMHRRSEHLIEDAMIAATARVHGLQVVTRNVKDFKDFGVGVLNPYAPL
jgi:predicted nucleic acid-binding protein